MALFVYLCPNGHKQELYFAATAPTPFHKLPCHHCADFADLQPKGDQSAVQHLSRNPQL